MPKSAPRRTTRERRVIAVRGTSFLQREEACVAVATKLGGLRRPRVPHRNSPATVLQLQNAMTPPPRPTPHRVLNNAHYRDIESLFKSRRGAAECPDRKDERSEIARGERSGTTDDRPDNGQKW